MKKIKVSEAKEIVICPYCQSETSYEKGGCCGESSGHFEKAWEYQGEIYLTDEVEFIPEVL